MFDRSVCLCLSTSLCVYLCLPLYVCVYIGQNLVLFITFYCFSTHHGHFKATRLDLEPSFYIYLPPNPTPVIVESVSYCRVSSRSQVIHPSLLLTLYFVLNGNRFQTKLFCRLFLDRTFDPLALVLTQCLQTKSKAISFHYQQF